MFRFLDTDVCIAHLKGRDPSIRDRIAALSPRTIRLPSIVLAELLLGAEKSRRRARTLEVVERFVAPFEIVAFDEAAAAIYAKIRADLESRDVLIGPNDLVIAATTVAHAGTLVTRNAAEFERVDGLGLECWAAP